MYVTLRVAEWKPCSAVILISHLPGFVTAFTTTDGARGIGRGKRILLLRQLFSVHEEFDANARRLLNRLIRIHHEVQQGLGRGFQRSAEYRHEFPALK